MSVRELLTTLFGLMAASALVVWGVALMHEPTAFIVAGLMVAGLTWLFADQGDA